MSEKFDKEVLPRIQPHLNQLQLEFSRLRWSSYSAKNVTAALSGLRGEVGSEIVDHLFWFVAALMAQMRPPTDKEAAELDLPLAFHEELRELFVEQDMPGPMDVIH